MFTFIFGNSALKTVIGPHPDAYPICRLFIHIIDLDTCHCKIPVSTLYSTKRIDIINPSKRWKMKHSCIYTCNRLYENRDLNQHLPSACTHEYKTNFEFIKNMVVIMTALKMPRNLLRNSIKNLQNFSYIHRPLTVRATSLEKFVLFLYARVSVITCI